MWDNTCHKVQSQHESSVATALLGTKGHDQQGSPTQQQAATVCPYRPLAQIQAPSKMAGAAGAWARRLVCTCTCMWLAVGVCLAFGWGQLKKHVSGRTQAWACQCHSCSPCFGKHAPVYLRGARASETWLASKQFFQSAYIP